MDYGPVVFPDLGFLRKTHRVSFVLFLLDIFAPFLNNGIRAQVDNTSRDPVRKTDGDPVRAGRWVMPTERPMC